ncbi:nucleoside 2-deoxyribosyltransferase [Pseudomonas sp. 910_23]|uniref:nucleoside 2-deoxyribosyltransferase n=1 Tax=Pseudomonas sp. 910_23 TaxID=2604461 RepID=UPI0040631825
MKSFQAEKQIYFAAPLFNDMERSFNLEVVKKIERNFSVFLPQRDGYLLRELVASGISLERARTMVYENDLMAIRGCKLVVAILDGRTIDEGVAVELGFAKALGKVCLALKTDDRAMLPGGDNPMVMCSCDKIFSSIEELVEGISLFVLRLKCLGEEFGTSKRITQI